MSHAIRRLGPGDEPVLAALADDRGAESFCAAAGFRRGTDDEQGVLMVLGTAGDVG